MRVLITGITGFAGSHLADFLSTQKGVEIHGIHRWRSNRELIAHHTDIHLHECDLADYVSVHRVLAAVRPDRVFHLAAQSFVPTSWVAPSETLFLNVHSQLHLFEAARQIGLTSRFQIAGSSEEYGLVHPSEAPIREDNPLRPLSPYGVSKVAQDLLAYQYHASYGTDAVRTRGFNHTGPRRPPVFVASNFAWQIARIEKGVQPPVIEVGDLTSVRDFTDVRDVVRAYWKLLERGEAGEVYNVCSGNGVPLREIAARLLALAGVRAEVRVDPDRLRPADIPVLVGDNSRLRRATGWEPRIGLQQTLRDLLDYWRARLADEPAPARAAGG
jgi:GDP-4-dehydro-6-deoxy-D-mannose reductase